MSSRQRIYPLFIPHAGCPFQCVYCNQHLTTASVLGKTSGLVEYCRERLEALARDARQRGIPGELAFYGGTFTALPCDTLRGILDTASSLIDEGIFTAIRFSTRPDCITGDVCDLLAGYPIRTVELGVQSLSDEVLRTSRRGYTGERVRQAVELVKAYGWNAGIQLMPGLPGDTPRHFLDSVQKTIGLGPALVRIYPTVVLKDTPLAEWYLSGNYHALGIEEAIQWCVPAYDAFIGAGIPVARMGLHADPELQKPETIVAGPYHPAFGYLVKVHRWRNEIDKYLEGEALSRKKLCIFVPWGSESEVIGPGRENLHYWRKKWSLQDIRVAGKSELPPGHFSVSIEE